MARPTLTFRIEPSGRIVAELAPGVPVGEIMLGHFGTGIDAAFFLSLPPFSSRQAFKAKDVPAAKRAVCFKVSDWLICINALDINQRVRCDDPAMSDGAERAPGRARRDGPPERYQAHDPRRGGGRRP